MLSPLPVTTVEMLMSASPEVYDVSVVSAAVPSPASASASSSAATVEFCASYASASAMATCSTR